MRYTFEEEFRIDEPETVGEKNRHFDLDNYKGWLEAQLIEARKQLALYNVTPRYIFDEGIKYAKELAKKNDQELNLDTCTMIASDYTKHVAHFLRNNVG